MCLDNTQSLPANESTAPLEPIISLNEDEVCAIIGWLNFIKEDAHEELLVEDEELLQRLEDALTSSHHLRIR